MDGGYYKAFQKRLSRPQPPIFNKIFSQTRKQSRAFPARPVSRTQAPCPLPRAVIHSPLMVCRRRSKGAAGQMQMPREGAAHARATPRSILQPRLFSRGRRGHSALRHIAASKRFAALNQCRLFPDEPVRIAIRPVILPTIKALPFGVESTSSLLKRRISSPAQHCPRMTA